MLSYLVFLADKTKRFFLPTFKTGTMFWPLANVANFLYVPATARIAYINGCGIFWNTYMSYANQKPRVE